MAAIAARVLGIDTSLRSSGVGVVEQSGSQLRAIDYGTIRNKPTAPLSACLRHLSAEIATIIANSRPDAVAIEGVFFCKNVKTAIKLGEARGSAIAACAAAGLPIYEYAPRRVKQAVVGNGGAQKEQVRAMVQTMLKLAEEPQEDAGDALAIAITHLHSTSVHESLAPKAI